MMSPHEQRVLHAIEEQLSAEDPALNAALSRGPGAASTRWMLVVGGAVVAFGVLVVGIGVILLNTGLVLLGLITAGTGWFVRTWTRRPAAPEHRDDRPEPPRWSPWP